MWTNAEVVDEVTKRAEHLLYGIVHFPVLSDQSVGVH